MLCHKSIKFQLLPENTRTCNSDKQCINLYNNKPCKLIPGRVNFIDVASMSLSMDYVLQVKNHLCHKPWRIMTQFLVPNPNTYILTLPIISTRLCRINYGDILCHVKLVSVTSCIDYIKGKITFFKNISLL